MSGLFEIVYKIRIPNQMVYRILDFIPKYRQSSITDTICIEMNCLRAFRETLKVCRTYALL